MTDLKLGGNDMLDIKRISDLLCCALEGGSNYWYCIDEFGSPPELKFRSNSEEIFRHLDYPLNEGGYLMISVHIEDSGAPKRLDLDTIKRGLGVMAEKYPRDYGNFIKENEDSETGDVFLQCCLFGEIVYG